jgi:PAS domain S-box-containing protein
MARILIAEDDSVVAWNIRETLENSGHIVVGNAVSGSEVLNLVEATRPDLVLMDIRLKGQQGNIDGIVAAEQIYTRFNIPVIYLTAYTDEATLQRAKLSAPFGYLVKPLREQELLTTLEITLYRHQIERRSHTPQSWELVTLASIGDAAIATDREGRVTFMNPVAERLTGWRQQEALGKPIGAMLHLLHAETREPLENPVLSAIQQGKEVRLLQGTRLLTKDGDECLIGDVANPIRDQEGAIIGGILIVQDVTARSQKAIASQPTISLEQVETFYLEAELFRQAHTQMLTASACVRVLQQTLEQVAHAQDENQLLQAILPELGQAVEADYCWVTLYDQQQTTATIAFDYVRSGLPLQTLTQGTQIERQQYPQFYLLLSQQGNWLNPTPDALPAPYRSLLQPNQQLLICSLLNEQLAIGEVGILLTHQALWTQSQADLITDVINQVVMAPRRIRVQQRIQTHEELMQLNQLKEDFLSSVSHELRTPLTNMRMAIEMLQRIVTSLKAVQSPGESLANQQLLWQRMERYLQILHDEWRQEFHLIADLLSFSDTETVTEPLLRTSIDLYTWLPEAVARFMEQAKRQQQTLTCEVEQNLAPIISHESSLQRIVDELLRNACKYTPPAQQIKVNAYAQREQVLLSVTNTGIEIPTEELERIFYPLHRVTYSQSWSYRGLGLGLALVKRLVRRLGGTVHAQAGSGMTKFIVSLPYEL